MATYKVSYKVLAKQGDELKAVAKMVDGYADRVKSISSKLGDDKMLAEVRNNLQKLNSQLAESRVILNTAGELLSKTVQTYTTTEKRQVKKVDNLKAHNRDFYKNPVVVASVGGATAAGVSAQGAGAAAATVAPTAATVTNTTVNYTDNSTNIQYTEQPAAYTATEATPTVAQMSFDPGASAATVAPEVAKATMSAGGVAGVAAGVGVAGGAIGAGAVMGIKHIMDEKKKDSKDKKPAATPNTQVHLPNQNNNSKQEYNPEAELEAALERVRMLDEEE